MRPERKIFFRRSIFVLAAFLFIALLFAAPVAAAFSGGSGTQSDPYLIKTETDLRQLATDVNGGITHSGKYFRLENDIRLTQQFTPIGSTYDRLFSGYFDGNGHAVSNLKVTGAEYAGLFGNIASTATLSNLGVYATDISGKKYAGGLVGRVTSNVGVSPISNCYAVVSGSVTATDYTGYSGGLVGASERPVSNCYVVVSGSVTSNGGGICYAGGLVGETFAGVSNCYAVVLGSVTTQSNTYCLSGGLVGRTSGGSVSDSVALVSTVGGKTVGRITGDDGSLSNCYAWDQMTPASGSTFRTGESYTAVTSANVLKQSWWTASPKFSTSTWEWTSYYALPSTKTLPAPIFYPLTSLEAGAPTYPANPVPVSAVGIIDTSNNPLAIFGVVPSLTLTLRHSVTNVMPSSGGVTMTDLGNGNYSYAITGLTPGTKYYWWVIAPSVYAREETGSFTTADFTLGTPTHSDLTATSAKVSFKLTGPDVSADINPFIHYGTQNDITKSVAVPAVYLPGTPDSTYTAVLSGLVPGTTYYYWAEHAGITKPGSPVSFTTSAVSGTTPTVTTGSTMATVTFTATVPLGSTYDDLPDASVLFSTGTASASADVVAASPISVSGTTATYKAVVTGLNPGTTYNFWSKIGTGSPSSMAAKQTSTFSLGSPSAGTLTQTGAKITVTLTNPVDSAQPVIYYGTGSDASLAKSVTAIRSGTTTTYYANLDDLVPGTTYYYWAQYSGQTNAGSPATFKTTASAVPTVSVTPARNTPTSATFSITTANGDGLAPVLSYWTDPARKYTATAVATGTANKWTITVSDLIADTAYSYSVSYNGATPASGTLAADASKYTITITSPVAGATGISANPLILWTISNVDQGLAAVEPKITISGGAGEIIGTTNTGETSGTRTYQTALRGLDLGKTYSVQIEYGGATITRSFTTAAAPAAVTLNAPRLLTGTLTETGAAFIITVDNVADTTPGAVFLLYSTANDAGNATAITATPGTTQGTTRGYYAALENLVPGTQYYIWSWIEGFTPVSLSSGILTDSAEIKIDTRFTTITTGSAATITTTGGPGTTNLKWTSDNPAVIQIDRYSGEIIAHKTGTAEITAAGNRPDGSTTTAALTITVKDETPVSTTGWNAETPVTATVSAGSAELIKIPTLTRGTTTGFISTSPLDTTIQVTDGSSNVPYTQDGNVLKITTPEPGKTYTATFTGRKLGDLDGDGIVDVADALKITRYVAELDPLDDYQLVCGDINALAGVTAKDALAILEYTVGIKNADYRYI